MPSMSRLVLAAGLTAAAVATAAAAGCGGGNDQASKLAGTWRFDSGSLAASCSPPLPPNPATFDLTGLDVTIVKTGDADVRADAQLQADGPLCQVTFHVSGDTATANPGQVCIVTITVGGVMTMQNFIIDSWTLTLDASTRTINTAIMGSVPLCTASGSGVLGPGAGGGG